MAIRTHGCRNAQFTSGAKALFSRPIKSVLISNRSRQDVPRVAARCFFHMAIKCGKSS